MKKLMAGNWKMYKTVADGAKTAADLVQGLAGALPDSREVLLIPPFTALGAVNDAFKDKPGFFLGAQNFYPSKEGAFTGEVAPFQLLDAGCAFALAGHSERRHILGESDEFVGKKVVFGLENGLRMILCVGEKIEERKAGKLQEVLERQLKTGLSGVAGDLNPEMIAIAYEPVWAIGTGEVAGPEDILAAHAFVRNKLLEILPAIGAQIRILYGGSVKPDNIDGIIGLDNVDGVLVGGASLNAEGFRKIVLGGI